METCPLCEGTSAQIAKNQDDMYEVSCDRCNFYFITDEGIQQAKDVKRDLRYLLPGYARTSADANRPLMITGDTVHDLLGREPPVRTVTAKMRLLLLYISYITDPHSSMGITYDHDYPVAFATGGGELRYLLNTLIERRLVERIRYDEPEPDELVALTVDGWELVDKMELVIPSPNLSNKCFVAMWFDPLVKEIYGTAIAPAVKRAGFTPIRVDLLEHNERIDDRIIAEIRDSALVIADFTGHRHGVYFEAGFAMGLGLPVIWCCRESDMAVAHFDTRQYNHILWTAEDPKKFEDNLYYRIRVTVPRAQRDISPHKWLPWLNAHR